MQVRSVAALYSLTEESEWSAPKTINIKSFQVPAGFPANFSNPRLIQENKSFQVPAGFPANFSNPRLIQENNLTLSVEISVHWKHPESAGDITCYEVYTGYEELRPYDMYPSASATCVERTSVPDIRVSMQVVYIEQQVVGCDD